MFVDTHCHINMMVKKNFDAPLTPENLEHADAIIASAARDNVTTIINVGTSLPESRNCVAVAKRYPSTRAAVGLHPNDCTAAWQQDLREIRQLVLDNTRGSIVAIGECGLDRHYPDYNLQRQKDAFRAQIELALEHDLALIIHTRDARDETARIMEEFKGDVSRGVVHCFSEDLNFAQFSIELGYALGIGGTITYPKNDILRTVVTTVPLSSIILETDAPFLPPQSLRGKQNHPHNIPRIAEYLAELRSISIDEIAASTTERASAIFRLLVTTDQKN